MMQFLEFYYRNGHKEIGIPFACTEEIVNNLCLGLIIHLFRIICGRQCNKRGTFFRTLRGKMLKINQSSAKRTAKMRSSGPKQNLENIPCVWVMVGHLASNIPNLIVFFVKTNSPARRYRNAEYISVFFISLL